MKFQSLDPKKTGLLIVDVQEKLFPLIDHPCEVLDKLLILIRGCRLLNLPIVISEQYPRGLGSTIESVREAAGKDASTFTKTTFSCLNDPHMRLELEKNPCSQWVIAGIEAHVCILQTARSLLEAGKQVVVANDAISSRSIYDFSTAISELRDMGARISSTETILFDLLADSKHPEFKAFSALIK